MILKLFSMIFHVLNALNSEEMNKSSRNWPPHLEFDKLHVLAQNSMSGIGTKDMMIINNKQG
jgi:hypothetical protein